LQLWTGEDIPELTTSAPMAVQKKPSTNKVDGDNSLIELVKGDDNWVKVVGYIEANKGLGVEKIGKQLVRKYKISTELKKEIIELIAPPTNE